jgi:hypothetical protein
MQRKLLREDKQREIELAREEKHKEAEALEKAKEETRKRAKIDHEVQEKAELMFLRMMAAQRPPPTAIPHSSFQPNVMSIPGSDYMSVGCLNPIISSGQLQLQSPFPSAFVPPMRNSSHHAMQPQQNYCPLSSLQSHYQSTQTVQQNILHQQQMRQLQQQQQQQQHKQQQQLQQLQYQQFAQHQQQNQQHQLQLPPDYLNLRNQQHYQQFSTLHHQPFATAGPQLSGFPGLGSNNGMQYPVIAGLDFPAGLAAPITPSAFLNGGSETYPLPPLVCIGDAPGVAPPFASNGFLSIESAGPVTSNQAISGPSCNPAFAP